MQTLHAWKYNTFPGYINLYLKYKTFMLCMIVMTSVFEIQNLGHNHHAKHIKGFVFQIQIYLPRKIIVFSGQNLNFFI